ncbi:hypothetical protein H8959_001485 [Pygathrix nigripes]
MTEVERTYSANCSDFLESKGCFANTTSSGKSVSSSSSVETGPSVSEPPGLPRVSAYLDTTADLDQKPSSSHSGHSSEMSLPQVQKDKYPEEFSLLKLQTNIDPRNGIPKLTPGDNPYMYPEQSKGFHKAGSTFPPVNFSTVPYEKKFDTFIPLEPLPQIPKGKTCGELGDVLQRGWYLIWLLDEALQLMYLPRTKATLPTTYWTTRSPEMPFQVSVALGRLWVSALAKVPAENRKHTQLGF